MSLIYGPVATLKAGLISDGEIQFSHIRVVPYDQAPNATAEEKKPSQIIGGSVARSEPDRGYVWQAIDCAESDEADVSNLYNAYLHVLQGRVLEPEMNITPVSEISFPASKAEVRGKFVAAGLTFYISPNQPRGFELFFPIETVELRGSRYVLKERLVLAKQSFKSEFQYLELKRPDRPTP